MTKLVTELQSTGQIVDVICDSEDVAYEKIMSIHTLDDLDRYVRRLEGQYEITVRHSWDEELVKIESFVHILEQAIERWNEIASSDEQVLKNKGG